MWHSGGLPDSCIKEGWCSCDHARCLSVCPPQCQLGSLRNNCTSYFNLYLPAAIARNVVLLAVGSIMCNINIFINIQEVVSVSTNTEKDICHFTGIAPCFYSSNQWSLPAIVLGAEWRRHIKTLLYQCLSWFIANHYFSKSLQSLKEMRRIYFNLNTEHMYQLF